MASLREKGGRYHARHIYYVNGKRKEKWRALDTTDKAVAKKRLRGFEAEIEAIKHGEVADVPFEKAVASFLKHHCRGLKPASKRRYETSIKQLMRVFEGVSILKIGTNQMIEFEDLRSRDGVVNASIRRDLVCLSSILSHCIEQQWLLQNPVGAHLKRAKKRGLRESDARKRYLSEDEEKQLLAAIFAHSGDKFDPYKSVSPSRIMLHAAVIFSLDTGSRLEECAGLEWQNVQLNDRPHVTFVATKSGKPRTVPLWSRVQKVLTSLPVHPTSPYVFWHGDGQRYKNWTRAFGTATKKAGLNDLTWHDLRRTCGCRLLQGGYGRDPLSMTEVRDWLGHASVTTTEKTYAFLKSDQLLEVVERAQRDFAQHTADVVPLRKKRA